MATRPDSSPRTIKAAEFKPTLATPSKIGFFVRPIHVVTLLLFITCSIIAWFFISARSLIITTQPNNAIVNLSGGFSFNIGANYLLLPGDYQVSVQHPEFFPLEESIAVSKDKIQNYKLELSPLPGKLQVITQPLTDGQVYLDDQLAGLANQLIEQVAAGKHSYRVISDRFLDAHGEIEIKGRKQLQELTVSLEPAWANITIDSTPSGAEIFIEDERLGRTPATVEVLAGDREIKIAKSGYKTRVYPLTIEPQADQDLGSLVLQKSDGLVIINSIPAGASVTLDGQYIGQTPLEAAVVPGEDLKLFLFKDGYQSVSDTIAIHSGQSVQRRFNLPVLLGEVAINATPKDALLYIDGRLSGRANQTLQLPAKQHQIKIVGEGFVDFSTTIIPRPGLAQHLAPKLKTLEQAKWETIKPVIIANGQSLKLFRPEAKFQMGSSRREQGRRANETLHTVELTRPFYLATHETTNAQFRKFMREHSSNHVSGNSLDSNDNPVVNITWIQAALYCNWLSSNEGLDKFYQIEGGKLLGFNPATNGYRLPTEAEWAWAARFDNGTMLKFSWGPGLPPPDKSDNIGDRSAAALLGTIQVNYDDGFAVTAPVGQFQPNQHGLYDLNGNAAEWVHDFYTIKTGLSSKAELDPLGPLEGDFHVIRGGSWASGGISDLRLSYRDYGQEEKNTVGFRVARYVE